MTENQHRKISGYGDLDESEIALMNRIKAKEAEAAELVQLVRATIPAGEPQRQVAIAIGALEEGFMRLVRAVARPASPWERKPAAPQEPAT